MKLTRADGTVVDAEFSVSEAADRWVVTLDSRSGARASDRARNPEYNEALRALLQRFQEMGATIVTASVDSSYMRANRNRIAVIPITDLRYPIRLDAVGDLEQLRLSLTRGQRGIGRRAGTLPMGGNNSKRLRLEITFDEPVIELQQALAAPGATDSVDTLLADLSASQKTSKRRRWLSTPAERQAVEARAMQMAIEHYRREGWTVDDVSDTSPYDLLCTAGKKQLAVEVKGSRGDGSVVQLTRNEVAWIRSHHPNTELFILSKVVLQSNGGDLLGTGGLQRIITRWRPNEEDLTALAFDYLVPF